MKDRGTGSEMYKGYQGQTYQNIIPQIARKKTFDGKKTGRESSPIVASYCL